MQSLNNTRFYSFRAEANVLGGFLEKPFRKVIPTIAPVSLPAVGGFATARSEAFTFEEIVSFSSAYTRISGEENTDGSVSILVTAVVEGLSILEVVEAERIVAQLSIAVPSDRGPFQVSTAGSQFDELRVAGHLKRPRWNGKLQHSANDQIGRLLGFTAGDAAQEGLTQATQIIDDFKNSYSHKWAEKRFEWMKGKQPRNGNLCSLLDGFEGGGPRCCGHVVEIPGFGRFIFGELLISPDSVQLVSVRAELGCPVQGQVTVNCPGGGGISDN